MKKGFRQSRESVVVELSSTEPNWMELYIPYKTSIYCWTVLYSSGKLKDFSSKIKLFYFKYIYIYIFRRLLFKQVSLNGKWKERFTVFRKDIRPISLNFYLTSSLIIFRMTKKSHRLRYLYVCMYKLYTLSSVISKWANAVFYYASSWGSIVFFIVNCAPYYHCACIYLYNHQ